MITDAWDCQFAGFAADGSSLHAAWNLSLIHILKDYKARYLGEGAVDPNMKLFYEEKVGKEEA